MLPDSRLSTIRRADRIVFPEDGEAKDIGDHDASVASSDSQEDEDLIVT